MFGLKLQQLRENLGLSQADLAMQTGLSVEALQDLEAGAVEPSQEVADQLARALGVPREDLEAAASEGQQTALGGNAVSVAYEKP